MKKHATKKKRKEKYRLAFRLLFPIFLIVTIEKIGLPEKMESFLVTSLLLSSVYRALSILSEKKTPLMNLAQKPLFLTYAKCVKKKIKRNNTHLKVNFAEWASD